MSETIEERKESIKLDLAEKLMKTIPNIPDDIHTYELAEQDAIFKAIDSRAERILELLGDKPKRRTAGRSSSPRRSERFNTPELDKTIVKKRSRPRDLDEE